MEIVPHLAMATVGLGAALLFFLTDRRRLARLSPLFLPWGEVSHYIKKIAREFGFLHALGLGKQVAIYVLSSDAKTANFVDSEALEVEQVIQRAHQEKKTLLMVGAPVSGKTTLLQVLAVRLTEREACQRFGFSEPRIPVYLPAKEIDFSLPFLAALQQASAQTSCPISQKAVKRAVQTRRAFFLFDGLDEIPAGEERRKACAWLEAAQQWCGFETPFVITCRATAILEDVRFNTPYLTVAIRNPALTKVRSLRAVSESRMPPRFFNSAEENTEYVLIAPPAIPAMLLGAKKPAPAYYYYLAQFPVTNQLYRKFVEAAQHRAPAFGDDSEFNGDDYPVIGVDWDDAQAYCAWLSEQANSEGRGATGVIFRLPLEEEWEWAASGGKRKYPWGNAAPQNHLANFNGRRNGLTAVTAFPSGATLEGLQDMAGNVWEWTATWLDEKKEQRVVRGGAGFNDEVALRCVSRDYNPKKLMRFVGFRVARIVPEV